MLVHFFFMFLIFFCSLRDVKNDTLSFFLTKGSLNSTFILVYFGTSRVRMVSQFRDESRNKFIFQLRQCLMPRQNLAWRVKTSAFAFFLVFLSPKPLVKISDGLSSPRT